MKRLIWIMPAIALAALAAWFLLRPTSNGIPVYAVEVVATRPHDARAFTQGLFFHQGHLYESTGEVGTSGIRKVNAQTGEVLQSAELPAPYFGEGIVGWKDRLYQLTWQDRQGFIYSLADFTPTGAFQYEGEGWGLTHDGKRLILSDGTATLRFLDPETLAPTGTLAVTANGCPVEKLNELEWIDGQIYANIWQTDLIARIDPATGKVTSFLDVTALGPDTASREEVANGIAYDPGARRLFLTGKRWPQLYEVRATEKQAPSEAAVALTQCTGG